MTSQKQRNGRKPPPAKRGPPTTVVIKQKASARASSTKNTVPRSLIHKACGLVDPFCIHAIGARYPDDSSTRTVPFSFHSSVNVTTDANGNATLLWSPQYAFAPTTTATTTGPGVTGWNAFAAIGLVGDVKQYRIVSSGFIIRSIAAPLNASGLVQIRTWSDQDNTSIATCTLNGYNGSYSADIPLRICDDVAVITPHSSAMPQTFYNDANDSATVVNKQANGFVPVTVFITGAPINFTVAVIEYFINYELTFIPGSGSAQMATPPPAANPVLSSVANHMTSTVQPIVKRGVAALGSMIVDKAITGFAAMLGGPAAGMAAHAAYAIRDVD